MRRLAKAAVLSALADRLRERGSWTGSTHLQKAAYFLQEALDVPLGYDFILYKHGPFAFDLKSDLTEFAADRIIEVRPQTYPYGPRLETSQHGHELQARFPRTLRSCEDAIARVADLIRDRNVGELERLGTALLLLKESPTATDDDLAQQMVEIKPHVSRANALAALEEVRGFLAEEQSR